MPSTAERKQATRNRVNRATAKASTAKPAAKKATTTRSKNGSKATATRKPQASKPQVVNAEIEAAYITDPLTCIFGKFDRDGKPVEYTGPKGDGGVCFSEVNSKGKVPAEPVSRQVYISQAEVQAAADAGADTSKCTVVIVWEA